MLSVRSKGASSPGLLFIVVTWMMSLGESLNDSSSLMSARSLNHQGFPDDVPTTEHSNNHLGANSEAGSPPRQFGLKADGTQDLLFRLKNTDGLTDSQKDSIETLIQQHGTKDTKLMYEYRHTIIGFAMESVTPVLRGKLDDLLRSSMDHVETVS